MKLIASAVLAGAALLTAAVPASADEGPIDFGILQGVNETTGSRVTNASPNWRQTNNEETNEVPKSALITLLEHLTTP